MTRKNIILLAIAAAIAAFLFPPYTLKNHRGVVIDSGYYFVFGERPIYPTIENSLDYLARTGQMPTIIHATVNTTMLLIELAVIGIAGAALAYTSSDRTSMGDRATSSLPTPATTRSTEPDKIPLSEAELKMKNAKGWALSALSIGALIVIVGIVLSPGDREEITLQAVKGAMGVSFWAMVAFTYGWFTGGKK